MLILLLGQNYRYKTEGEKLLENVLARLSLTPEHYRVFYCYESTPASRVAERPRDVRREALLKEWSVFARGVIVGFGWMACDILFHVGKSRMKTRIDCKWPITGSDKGAWLTYDPAAAALHDPNLAVNIMGTISAAVREDGHQIKINTSVMPYNWGPYLWGSK